LHEQQKAPLLAGPASNLNQSGRFRRPLQEAAIATPQQLMKVVLFVVSGMLMAAPSLAQDKQKTDGADPTSIGPASKAYRQQTDGADPTSIGPASGAYKQNTQSLSHSASPTDKKQD
jgi:hypothetical protein